jgi:hypothetical protein
MLRLFFQKQRHNASVMIIFFLPINFYSDHSYVALILMFLSTDTHCSIKFIWTSQGLLLYNIIANKSSREYYQNHPSSVPLAGRTSWGRPTGQERLFLMI